MKVRANGVDIEVEDTGADGSQADRPVVLLIMGLGMQLIAWPAEFLQALLDAGFRVVRFDNRDIGLSQKFDHLGTPNLLWETLKRRMGFSMRPPYTLQDMAADTLGVLDALGIAKAHLVGVSMGGMIAQRVAATAPQRVSSLTSVMSSSGAAHLPGPRPEVLRALMSRPRGNTESAVIDHTVKLFKAIGSPAFPMDDATLRDRIVLATRRSFNPRGTMRQMVAIGADAGRADALKTIRRPTLVVHGTDDPLVPFACGEDTVARIPGARMHAIEGMGHDLPPGVVERMLAPMLQHLKQA